MKTILLTLAVFVAIVAVVQAQDDPSKSWNIYLGAGGSLPMGDFKDTYGTGLHGTGAVGFNLAPGFQILGKVEYHTFSIQDDFRAFLLPGATNLDGGGSNVLMFGGDAKYNFRMENSKMSPYLIGGLGMASISFKDITGDSAGTSFTRTPPDGTTKLYFEVGAGLEFGSSDAMAFFVQGRYVSVATEGSSSTFIPLTVGIRF